MKKVVFIVVLAATCILSSCSRVNAFPAPSPTTADPPAPTTAGILFTEDFEDGLSGWRLENGWAAVSTDGGTALNGTGHQWAWCDSFSGADCSLKFSLKLASGTIHINIRYDNETGNRYFVGISDGGIYLNRQDGQQFTDLAEASRMLGEGWHDVQVKTFGGLINVYIDNELCIVYEDASPLPEGSIAFEALDGSDCMIDNITVSEIRGDELETESPLYQSLSSKSITPDTVHEGDLTLDGSDTMEIKDTAYLQRGNIYLNGNSSLIIEDSAFILGRGDTPTIHTYFFVGPGASLKIRGSTVITDSSEQMGALIIIRNEGNVDIADSQTQIHLIEMYDGAALDISGSTIINPIGGLIQVSGGRTSISDSAIGALGLVIPQNASLDISGLESGAYYDSWDVRDMIPEAGYELSLERTTILKDDLEYGPYERGWLFFPDPGSNVLIRDSELRKVFIDLSGDSATFSNLKMGVPSSLQYRNINLSGVIMRGEWPFTIIDSNVTISDSEYLFLQPGGNSEINLVDSNMVEFIPRDFKGTINFDNCTWTNAGEIIGGEDYHSLSNDFTMTGSLSIGDELREHLQWKGATVTREFETVLSDGAGAPAAGLTLEIDGGRYVTDENGMAVLNLIFTGSDYAEPRKLRVYRNDSLLLESDIDFFTETPVRIRVQE